MTSLYVHLILIFLRMMWRIFIFDWRPSCSGLWFFPFLSFFLFAFCFLFTHFASYGQVYKSCVALRIWIWPWCLGWDGVEAGIPLFWLGIIWVALGHLWALKGDMLFFRICFFGVHEPNTKFRSCRCFLSLLGASTSARRTAGSWSPYIILPVTNGEEQGSMEAY